MKNERPMITKQLSELLEKHINPKNDTRIYMAKEVTFDYGTQLAKRVDYMQFKPADNTISGLEKGDFFCYEIKSSKEDFHSPNGHNFIGDYNYYVMPLEVYEEVKEELPFRVGVYVPEKQENGEYKLKSVKQAKKQSRHKSALEMLFMMFRSANRDRMKV